MKAKYSINDEVYHVTPDSPLGVIIEMRYYYGSNKLEYLVVWSHIDSSWCLEHELIKDKRF